MSLANLDDPIPLRWTSRPEERTRRLGYDAAATTLDKFIARGRLLR
jgi:hypothetical protein